MRTTWNIDDAIVEEVKEFAQARSMSSGQAAGVLIRRGLRARIGIRYESGIPVFDTPEDSPVVTLEHTLRLEDELI